MTRVRKSARNQYHESGRIRNVGRAEIGVALEIGVAPEVVTRAAIRAEIEDALKTAIAALSVAGARMIETDRIQEGSVVVEIVAVATAVTVALAAEAFAAQVEIRVVMTEVVIEVETEVVTDEGGPVGTGGVLCMPWGTARKAMPAKKDIQEKKSLSGSVMS